jgi:hypothetical protein
MKVAIIHYHLKTGGVTTVVRHQVTALQRVCETLVVTGDRAEARMDCDVVEIPDLGYDRPQRSALSPDRVARQVLKAIETVWPHGFDLLHIHNPTLAKNRHFLQIIKRLQQLGVRLFLQIHDFAEDGRPDAYFAESYPADCHYGVLNRRDAGILKKAGLVEEGVHLVPNAVAPLPTAGHKSNGNLMLYPVRAIRRKNLGEAILISLFFGADMRLAITQPPNSPADQRRYGEWVEWVHRRRLPVDFAAGRHQTFADLVGAARAMITTSVTEGFGFCYLEPWTAGKMVWGRRLGAICDDFQENGIHLEGLYDRLDVPLTWIDADGLAAQWQASVMRASKVFGYPMEQRRVRTAFNRMTRDGRIDFGILSEPFQRQVLEKLLADDAHRRSLVSLNPWLAGAGGPPVPEAVIDSNRRVVARQYALSAFGDRLMGIYRHVVERPVRQRIDKAALVAAFLDLDRFSLLKWSTDG